MGELRPSAARRALPFVVGAAFLMTVTIAAWRMATLRDLAWEQERERTVTMVEEYAAAWEEDKIKALTDHIEAPPTSPKQARHRQSRLRKTRRWFDSLYVWRVRTETQPAEWVYPVAPVRPADLGQVPCVREAHWLARSLEPSLDNDTKIAERFVLGCQNEAPLVRIYAATEADYFLRETHPAQALAAMEAMRIDPSMSLAEAARREIPPTNLAIYRFRDAMRRIALGHDGLLLEGVRRKHLEDGLQGMWDLGYEITQLDAPEASRLLTQYSGKDDTFNIRNQLLRHGRHQDARRLETVWGRAERRRAAFREIRDKIATQMPESDEKPRFIWDQYSDTPFLVFFGWSNGHGTAFQIEQQLLLKDFLAGTREYRHQITITNADGEWVTGAPSHPNEAYVEIAPFKGLTHLRVRVNEAALDSLAQMRSEHWLLPFGIMGICMVLGIAALAALERFTRRQYELLNRQRAFTTRVTHELKTPLAGIRVMAENLEAGVFRTDEQRQEMARRIVEEADRLKARVDEVLDVARERTIPSPEPTDPEESVLEAIDQWGPRLEQAGVKLHADLHPTDEVLGDSGALRDAVGILLDNALKYRKPDSDAPQVWLELSQENRQIRIAVADNGLGVPKAMRKAIFDRFVRIEGPNRGPSGGHGLGLNQAREIVEAHKGSLVCTDGVDGGARFVIRLPARRNGG
ncbi:MAG: HAMP domain-containing sensor histidine kinase [Myxococcota bacterium]